MSTEPTTSGSATPEPAKGEGIAGLVNRVAGLLARGGGVLSVGDSAELRRMDPWRPSAAFFKLEGLALDPELPGEAGARQDAETRWAALVIGLAHLGDLHRPGVRLGRALVDAGLSELRFARLLRADTQRLVDELPMLARFLAQKGVAADWSHAARLILSAGRSGEETTRRSLARDFYGALAASKQE